MAALALERDVIAVDLPGFGETAPLNGEGTIATLTDAVEQFLTSEGLDNIDIVGSSMGARMVLEMARRGHAGTTVSLDPGGFWSATGRRPSSVPACGPPLRSSVESSPRVRFSPDTRVGALCCSRSSPPSLGDSTATALFPDPTRTGSRHVDTSRIGTSPPRRCS